MAVHLIIYILCFLGGVKRNMCLLIPFMVLTCIHILALLVTGSAIAYSGVGLVWAAVHGQSPGESSDWGTVLLLYLIALHSVFAVEVYFLVIAIKFYRDLERESEFTIQNQVVMLQQNFPNFQPLPDQPTTDVASFNPPDSNQHYPSAPPQIENELPNPELQTGYNND